MNKNNRQLLQKALKILKDLHFKEENIMVTGSIALDIQGVLSRPAHDVDFIIKTDDTTWGCLKLIEAINLTSEESSTIQKEYPIHSKKNFIALKIDGIILNIWRHSENFDWSPIKDAETGVYVATINHTINAKKLYGRDKDYKDIYKIVRNIM